jgi:transcriptional regulator with XRE-family HTH domain
MISSAEVSPPPSSPIPDLPPITVARLRLRMSAGDLARAAQIDPAHLDLIERRSDLATPTLDELERIAGILELTVDEIR